MYGNIHGSDISTNAVEESRNDNLMYVGKIPKKVHFYWDTSDMSYLYFLTLKTFREHNPDWEMNLYIPVVKTTSEVKWESAEIIPPHFISHNGKNWFDFTEFALLHIHTHYFDFNIFGISNNLPEVIKSDIFRYYILSTTGGVWSDLDILYTKPMKFINFTGNMLNGTVDNIDTVISYYKKNGFEFYYIGMLMASPNNAYYKTLFASVIKFIDADKYQCVGANMIKTLFKDSTTICEHFGDLNICNLDIKSIYTYTWFDLHKIFVNINDNELHTNASTEGIVGYHWFGGTYMSDLYKNAIDKINTHLNYKWDGVVPKLIQPYITDTIREKSTKRISIVMGYINRKIQLLNTLYTISLSKHKNLEVIIVDDGSITDEKITHNDIKQFKFDIKVINSNKSASILNPCVAYNIGFEHATGDIIIIQNPECCHIGDALVYINNNLREDEYFTFPCFYLWKFDQNDELMTIIQSNDVWSDKCHRQVCELIQKHKDTTILEKHTHGWVNHAKYNKTDLHFMSCIYRSKLNIIGGFDQLFKTGICFDDDDLIRDIRFKLKLNVITIPVIDMVDCTYMHPLHNNQNVFCIHQHHSHFDYTDTHIREKWEINRQLFINKHNTIVINHIDNIRTENLWNGDLLVNSTLQCYEMSRKASEIKLFSDINIFTFSVFLKNLPPIHYISNGGTLKFRENINEIVHNSYFSLYFSLLCTVNAHIYIWDNDIKEFTLMFIYYNTSTNVNITCYPSMIMHNREVKLKIIPITPHTVIIIRNTSIKLETVKLLPSTTSHSYACDVEKVVRNVDGIWPYPKIPKIGFSYWNGNMSYLNYLTLISFTKMNPTWRMQLYIPHKNTPILPTWDTDEQKLEYTGRDWTTDARNIKNIEIIEIDFVSIGFSNDYNDIIKSDYLRLYILSTQGGVWFDMDILFIRPMSCLNLGGRLLSGDYSLLDCVTSYYPGEFYYSVGFLLSSPDNCIFKMLLDKVKESVNAKNYQSLGANLFKTYFPTPNDIVTTFRKKSCADIGLDVVYPYTSATFERLFNYDVAQSYINFESDNILTSQQVHLNADVIKTGKNTIGVHWYNGSRCAKEFMNKCDYSRAYVINIIINKYII